MQSNINPKPILLVVMPDNTVPEELAGIADMLKKDCKEYYPLVATYPKAEFKVEVHSVIGCDEITLKELQDKVFKLIHDND